MERSQRTDDRSPVRKSAVQKLPATSRPAPRYPCRDEGRVLTLLLSENRRAQRPSIDSVSKMRISCAHKLRSGVCDMRPVYDDTAPKKATNLSINSDLLRKARELDINLSSALEQALEQIVKRRLYETWLEENRAAIESYNEHVERHGVFSDGVRGF